MELSKIFLDLGIALGLGLLVGLQRERVETKVAGIRTFSLVAVLGVVSVLVAERYGGLVIAAALLGLAGLIVVANVLKLRDEEPDLGLTTEVALLLTFLVGALVAEGYRGVAITLGGGLAVLLHWKAPMHRFAGRLAEDDVRAIFRFVLISLVILPVLPDRDFGPYAVLNPREIWWMVVLIVGISLAGYLGFQLLGARAGTLLGGGVLGGLVSSTAVTVSYARLSRGQGKGAGLAARVILIASAVVFVRVLVEAAVVSPALLRAAAPPLLVMTGVLGLLALAGLGRESGQVELAPQENPTELRTPLVFAVLYAAVLLAVAWAKDRLGGQGLYAVATLSGLTDMDAITLSTAQLVEGGRLDAATGWRLVLVGSLANLVFKAGIAGALGGLDLLKRLAVWWGIAVVVGAGLLAFW